MRKSLISLLALTSTVFAADSEPSKITHSFFIAGAETAILSNDGKPLWSYPAATRDGFVLPNGNLLLALAKNKDYPGGAVVEVTRENKIVFEFKGTQSEVNTAQLLPNGILWSAKVEIPDGGAPVAFDEADIMKNWDAKARAAAKPADEKAAK